MRGQTEAGEDRLLVWPLHPIQSPKLPRCHACVAAEVAGEGALITPAGFDGDVGQGEVGFAEEAGGFIEAEFVQELQRAHLKQALHALLKLIDTEACFFGDVLDAQTCGEVLLHVLQRCGEFGEAAGFVAGRVQVTRDAGDADDAAIGGAQGVLGGEAPASLVSGIDVEFELMLHGFAGFEHGLILPHVAQRQSSRKHLGRPFADELRFIATGAAICQRLIHPHIPPRSILDEEHDIRQRIEKRLGGRVLGEWAGGFHGFD